MDLGLRGRRAVITGGTRGIGRAIAETFAAEGANVAVCARDSGEVEQTVAALREKGVSAFGAVVDIADRVRLESWIEEAATQLGGIDALICNASAIANGDTDEQWEAAFTIDVLGARRAIRIAMPHLQAAARRYGDAAITILSSGAAAEALRLAAYGAMKAAQIHLVKTLARTYGPDHVRTNAISPGTVYFEGGVWQRIEHGDPEFFKKMQERNPLARMATAEEIANAAIFLSSPASAYTSGVNLMIDGAASLRVNF
jgi:3-oxoacyl-[acyl-carrier protein] reductase